MTDRYRYGFHVTYNSAGCMPESDPDWYADVDSALDAVRTAYADAADMATDESVLYGADRPVTLDDDEFIESFFSGRVPDPVPGSLYAWNVEPATGSDPVPGLPEDWTAAEDWLSLDSGAVPCSRYGSTSGECSGAAIAAACLYAHESGEPVTFDSLDGTMSRAVNDSDGLACIVRAWYVIVGDTGEFGEWSRYADAAEFPCTCGSCSGYRLDEWNEFDPDQAPDRSTYFFDLDSALRSGFDEFDAAEEDIPLRSEFDPLRYPVTIRGTFPGCDNSRLVIAPAGADVYA